MQNQNYCRYCNRTPFEGYDLCEVHICMGMGFEKKIYTFHSVNEVRRFISRLQGEFRLTNFAPVIETLRYISSCFYNIDFKSDESDNYGDISTICLQIASHEKNGVLDFVWTTSSEHIVHIVGTVEGEISLFIGQDRSEIFYPTIRKLLGLENDLENDEEEEEEEDEEDAESPHQHLDLVPVIPAEFIARDDVEPYHHPDGGTIWVRRDTGWPVGDRIIDESRRLLLKIVNPAQRVFPDENHVLIVRDDSDEWWEDTFSLGCLEAIWNPTD